MPRKPRRPAKSTKLPGRLGIKIVPQITDNVPCYHANYILVSHSEHEFALTLIQTPPLLGPDHVELAQAGKPVPLEPVAQIVMPAQVGIRLIKALESQKQKFEAAAAISKSAVSTGEE